MAELTLVGQIAGAAGQRVTLALIYNTDWRDSVKGLPLPVYLFESFDGGLSWRTFGGGLPKLPGAADASESAPRVSGVYTVFRPGLPPFARGIERHVFANTDTAGVFDFTLPEALPDSPISGPQAPPQVQVLPGQGEKGERGASILFGPSDPADGLGIDGDGYIDTNTFDFWERSAGAWQLVGNIKGGQGARGPEGPKGVDGKSFPVPTAAQLNFIPVADGSQPNGFSWYAASKVSGKSKFLDLLDVEKDSFSPDGAYLLYYNGETGRLEGVAAGGPVGGGGTVSGTEFYALAAPRQITEQPSQALYADVQSGDIFYFPPNGAESDFPEPLIRVIPKGEYLTVYSSQPFVFGNPGTSLSYSGSEYNKFYDGGGSIKTYTGLIPGQEYALWLGAGVTDPAIMAFDFEDGMRVSPTLGGITNSAFSETIAGSGYYEQSTHLYRNADDDAGDFVFKREVYEREGAGYMTSVRNLGNIRIQLHEVAHPYELTGTVIQEITPPDDGKFHVIRFRFPRNGYFNLCAVGRGEIITPIWTKPGIRQANPFRGAMEIVRTTNLDEIPPLYAGVYVTPDAAPRMVYKDENGTVWEQPPMTRLVKSYNTYRLRFSAAPDGSPVEIAELQLRGQAGGPALSGYPLMSYGNTTGQGSENFISDNDPATYWGGTPGSIFYFRLDASASVREYTLMAFSENHGPASWMLEGAEGDDVNTIKWEVIHTGQRAAWTAGETVAFTL